MSEQSPAPAGTSGESVIWRQFKKRKVGLVSLYFVMALFAIAVYAPLLANHNPLALKTTYGTLYAYYFSGWKSVHEIVAESVDKHDALVTERADSVKLYDDKISQIKGINQKYNEVGNVYDEARNAANRMQDEIEALGEQARALESEGQADKAAPLLAKRDEITASKKEVDVKVKESGAEKAKLKREMDELRGQQNEANDRILRTNFRLDYARHLKAIDTNLAQMCFPVDAETCALLAGLRDQYSQLLKDLVGGQTPAAGAGDTLKSISASVLEKLSPEQVSSKLVYRWTFPAMATLDWVDRLAMFGYALVLFFLLAGGRLQWTFTQKVVGAAVLALLLSLASSGLKAGLPDRNYKVLFLDNLSDGVSESVAILPPVHYGFNENRVEEKLQRPAFAKNESGQISLHLLGTDDYGRDVMSRMIWGARVSLSVGFVAVTLYVLIGIIVGSFAGFFGGKVDIVISRVIEIVMCFPSFFLILAVIAFIGPSIYNVMIVIGLTSWTGIARLTRGEFLRLRNLEFVLAAEAAGISKVAIMFKHVLPNAMTPVMVSAAFGFAGSILTESGLSYLGFGVQEPFPSWGQMLSDSQSNPLLYWWLFIVPGIALFLTVTFYNLAGNTFRDAADPRLRQ